MNNVILVGNPNVGKTTLYNTMTKSNEKASNWHGVTVDAKSKKYNYKNKEYTVTDLPGMYSLSGYSNEEKIANKYLFEHKNDVIVNICDANNLKRNLLLTIELVKNCFNVILAVNMCKEAKYDYASLAKIFGIKIVEIDARKKKSVNVLKDVIYENINYRNLNKNVLFLNNKEKIVNLNTVFSILDNSINSCYKKSDKIDKIVLNKFLFLPIFLIILFSIFYITFGEVGSFISGCFGFVFEKIFWCIEFFITKLNIAHPIKMFITEGILGAILTVVNFVPQIVLLMFFINLLEDTGYMSRVAFMFDGVLKKVGLTGKSLFSILMGYGCTASAVMTTRNLENKNLRKRTALLLPFASCTAKLPVFLVIASLFFESYKYLFVFLLYIFAILISVIFACIYKKFIPDKSDVFILEMPKYRMCNLKKISMDTLAVIKDFLIKVGTMILLFSSIVWVLQNFSIGFKYLAGENFNQSILHFFASKISPIFGVIGLGQVGIVSALLLGIVAKEMVVVGLAMMNGVGGSIVALKESLLATTSVCSFTPVSSIVFLVFILLYSPCISAISAIKNEFGRKTALYVFVVQFLISFVICFTVYRLLINVNFIYVLLSIIVVDIIIGFMLKLMKKKKLRCLGNCNACRKI